MLRHKILFGVVRFFFTLVSKFVSNFVYLSSCCYSGFDLWVKPDGGEPNIRQTIFWENLCGERSPWRSMSNAYSIDAWIKKLSIRDTAQKMRHKTDFIARIREHTSNQVQQGLKRYRAWRRKENHFMQISTASCATNCPHSAAVSFYQ